MILIALFLIAIGAVGWSENRRLIKRSQDTGVAHARQVSSILIDFRDVYTSEVVENLSNQSEVRVSHDYLTRGGVPLPATLTQALAARITDRSSVEISLYSPHPFPWRKRAPLDGFARDAWAHLTESPNADFYRFEDTDKGALLRYATADILRAECVECHNTHPNTPRAGWKTGDVRGVLEVRIPVRSVATTSDWNALFRLGTVVVFGLIGILVVARHIRRTRFFLEKTIVARTAEVEGKTHTLESIIESIVESIIVIDESGVIRSANLATEQMFQYSSSELVGENVSMLMPQPHRDAHNGYIQNYLDTNKPEIIGVGSRRLPAIRKDGSTFDIELSVSESMDGDSKIFTGIVKDISIQLAHEVELERLSREDPGTGLVNRRAFEEALESEWRRCQRNKRSLALLMLDLDYFKLYNDRYGHVAGDKCLARIARTLESTVKRAGDVVARFGGEEFILLLAEAGEEGARVVAERVRSRIEEIGIPHEDHPSSPVVTISAGIASIVPERNGSSLSLIKSADEALYRAKKQGRNRIST